jgi:gliding motility-associated-like protein
MFLLRTHPFSLLPAPLALLLLFLAALPGPAQTPNAAPTFTAGGNVTAAEDAGPQRVPWATALSAGPAAEAGQLLTFGVTTDNPALFAVPPALDASGTLTFTPAPNAYGAATVTVVLRDNGGTLGGGTDESLPQTFTLSVAPVNDAPAFAKGADIMVLENAGIQVREGWATALSPGPASEATQSLSFVVNNDNPALFSRQPALGADGRLTFTPAPGAYGKATVTVLLRDNGGVAGGGTDQAPAQTFAIALLPVNDAPSFTKGPPVSVPEDGGPQQLTGWATALAAGPANEAGQTLAFLVTASPTTLFKALPAVDPQGNLTFTPAPNAYGTATVTVVLRDNGGTADGGADRSLPQTFTLSILPVNDAPFLSTPNDVYLSPNSASGALWLTGITPGPGEAGQSLALTAVSGNPALLDITGVEHAAGGATASLFFQPRPGQTGTAAITLVLKDNGGTAGNGLDTYTTTFRVHVAEVSALFLPTLFSPNGDGQNDAFRVRGEGIAAVQLRVYAQNGVEVFGTSDVRTVTETGWDGTSGGRPLPAGVYSWVLRGNFADGSPLRVNGKSYGQVTLVR